MQRLIVPVGIPGSGKSTLMTHMAEAEGLVYVNPDTIRGQLTGDVSDQSRNAEVWEKAYGQIADALTQGRDVVIDATNTEPLKRWDLVTRSRQYAKDLQVELWWFTTSLEECKRRNAVRGREVPEWVLDMKWRQLTDQPVDMASEGFDVLVFV